ARARRRVRERSGPAGGFRRGGSPPAGKMGRKSRAGGEAPDVSTPEREPARAAGPGLSQHRHLWARPGAGLCAPGGAAGNVLAGGLFVPAGDGRLRKGAAGGLGLVAAGLGWRLGEEVITSDLEHVSGIAPWRELARRKGVVVKELASEDGYLEASRVLDAVTPRTRLICISHVSYATGA